MIRAVTLRRALMVLAAFALVAVPAAAGAVAGSTARSSG